MAENKIELKSVGELLGMKFFIPSYQRGYRWTKQQVKDLLNDVKEFIDNNKTGFYSLQPLVVKKKWPATAFDEIREKVSVEEIEDYINNCENNCEWEVIDGQQRLTTIFIILFFLNNDNNNLYTIEYQTRQIFTEFLKKVKEDSKCSEFKDFINNNIDSDNIDFYHIFTTFQTIREWFEKMEADDRTKYKEQLLQNVKFIWYESVGENPIKVFTRLNIGKIKLTNSELIKALLLNRSNFNEEALRHIQLRQQEIASEWDHIEYTLQNDEFWLFLHHTGYQRPTRIDFIFDLICDNENEPLMAFPNKEKKDETIGTDDYRTFRYFYEYFHQKDKNKNELINECWKQVKRLFQTFQEWFNDLTLYHYIGYLICLNEVNTIDYLKKLVQKWNGDKRQFIKSLKDEISEKITKCKDLNQQYRIGDKDFDEGKPDKGKCKPLLLLHNIQTVIIQNKELEDKKEYGLPVFYKFPFHLYKKEKWDVEHIDSNTANELDKEKDQKEWLKYTLLDEDIAKEETLKQKIKAFVSGTKGHLDFGTLAEELQKFVSHSTSSDWGNNEPEKEKNKIWNYVLLDAGTNRGYGNAIFPAKRRSIIGKDQGKKYIVDDNLKVTTVTGEENEDKKKNKLIAFVPPVTRNVFLKYYNTSIRNLKTWDRADAEAYKKNILETLKEFGVINN